MNNIKLSIALATFNGEKFLNAQLESIENQSVLPHEVIVSDDCSTDKTLSILEKFKNRAPFTVKIIINTNNVGYTQNFAKAICATTGELVFLCDQDDHWYPNKIEKMLEVVSDKPDYMVYLNDAELADSDLNPIGKSKLASMAALKLPEQFFIMGCCAVIRQEFLDRILPIPSEVEGHDDWIVGIAGALGLKYILNRPLQIYRRHGQNASNFAANTTIGTSKLQRFRAEKLRITEEKRSDFDHENDYLKQKKNFLEQIEILSEKEFFTANDGMNSYISNLRNDICVLTKRQKLRKKPFIKRFITSIYFYFFVYESRSKLQNLIRDLIA
jgi:glycosyltransferase involved in cell wall biosynthesis